MFTALVMLIVFCQGFLGMAQEIIVEEKKEVDIIDPNGQIYLEYTDVIEDLTSEYEMIAQHADGADLFITALWQSVENGEDTVKIPVEIDPEESSITIQDAIDKIEDMCKIDMGIAQRLQQKVNDLLAQMTNGTEAYSTLTQMQLDVESVIKIYNDVQRKVEEQRQSLTINQFYEYLYVDDEGPLDPEPMHENFNMIPYGDDAHDEDEDMTPHEFSAKSSAQDLNPRQKPPIKRPHIVTARKHDEFLHIPTFAIVFIVLSIAVFTLITIVLCVCVAQNRKQGKSSPPSLAEETKKEPIAIVTIPVDCHKPIQHTNTEQNDLPCYLDVICDKM